MIHLYTGSPGSGKSYHVAKEISFLLKRGKNVIANFYINQDKIKRKKGQFYEYDNFEITPELLYNFSNENHKRDKDGRMFERQTYLIIDECQLIFNARSWSQAGRNEWISYFTQHRKYGYEIILITQFDRLVDRQIRSLVEYEYRHRKVNNFGAFGFILGMVFLFKPIFVSVEYWYCIKERVGASFMVYNPKVASLYDSYKIF